MSVTELEILEPQNVIEKSEVIKGAGKRNLIVMQNALSRISEESSLNLGSLRLSSQQSAEIKHEFSESGPSYHIDSNRGDANQQDN